MLLTPVDRSAIYFGKAIGNLVFMFLVEMVVLPTYSVLYSVNLFNPGLLLVIMLWIDRLHGGRYVGRVQCSDS